MFLTSHKDWFSQSDSQTDQVSSAASFDISNGRVLYTSAQSPGGMDETKRREKRQADFFPSLPEQKFGCYFVTDLLHSGLDKENFCIENNRKTWYFRIPDAATAGKKPAVAMGRKGQLQ